MKTCFILLAFAITLSSTAQLKPDTLWSYKFQSTIMGNPLLEDTILYTGNEKGNVIALSTNTGKEIWKTFVGKGLYHNMVTTDKDLVLICAKSTEAVVPLNKKTGKQNWRIDATYKFDDDVPCQLIKDNDRIIFNSLDSTIVSLDINTGKEIWKYKAGGRTSPPVLYNNSILFICTDGNIYLLAKKTGKLESKINFGSPKKRVLFMTPIVYENSVVFSDSGAVITAVSLVSKKTLWKTESHSPFLFGFNEYVVSATDSGLFAFDIKTGIKKWNVPGRYHWYIYPCIFNDTFYYYSRKESKLLVINNKGTLMTEYRIKGKTYTAPCVTKNKIILSTESMIFAIENK